MNDDVPRGEQGRIADLRKINDVALSFQKDWGVM